jgi:hypothetical protein
MFFPMGPHVMYLTLAKWLWDPHVGKFKIYIVGMGMHRSVKQMGNTYPKKRAKTVIPKKWLIVQQIKGVTNIHL